MQNNYSAEEVKSDCRFISKASGRFSARRVDNIRHRAPSKHTQQSFADALGISVVTYRNWEQGRKQPTGPARTLLLLVEQFPDEMMRLLGACNSAK